MVIQALFYPYFFSCSTTTALHYPPHSHPCDKNNARHWCKGSRNKFYIVELGLQRDINIVKCHDRRDEEVFVGSSKSEMEERSSNIDVAYFRIQNLQRGGTDNSREVSNQEQDRHINASSPEFAVEEAASCQNTEHVNDISEGKTKAENRMGNTFVEEATVGILKRTGEDLTGYLTSLLRGFKCNSYLWDQVIKKVESIGGWEKAYEAFQFLQQQRAFKIQEQNYVTMIGILGGAGELDIAQELIQNMRKKGIKTTTYSYTTLISGYIKHGFFEQAWKIYEEMQFQECKPDIATYTCLILACMKCDLGAEKAMQVFSDMKKFGGKGDEIMYNCLTNACIHDNSLESAEHILKEMDTNNITANVVTCTSLINAYGKAGRLEDAIKIFHKMKKDGPKPNAWTYNALLRAYWKEGLPKEGQDLYGEMITARISPDLYTYNILIGIYAESGQFDDIEKTFNEMSRKGIKPDQVTYNTLLDTYTKEGFSGRAGITLEEMKSSGCRPNIWTYNILINATGKEGNVSEVSQLYQDLKDSGHVPNIVTYGSMISIYGRQGLYEDARKIWNEMCSAGCKPNIITFSGMIEGYSYHGMHEEALSCFQDMVKSGIQPDTYVYTSLMDAYGQAGLCEKAEELLFEMKALGLVPDRLTYGILLRAFEKANRLYEGFKYHEKIIQLRKPNSHVCKRLVFDYKERDYYYSSKPTA